MVADAIATIRHNKCMKLIQDNFFLSFLFRNNFWILFYNDHHLSKESEHWRVTQQFGTKISFIIVNGMARKRLIISIKFLWKKVLIHGYYVVERFLAKTNGNVKYESRHRVNMQAIIFFDGIVINIVVLHLQCL